MDLHRRRFQAKLKDFHIALTFFAPFLRQGKKGGLNKLVLIGFRLRPKDKV